MASWKGCSIRQGEGCSMVSWEEYSIRLREGCSIERRGEHN